MDCFKSGGVFNFRIPLNRRQDIYKDYGTIFLTDIRPPK